MEFSSSTGDVNTWIDAILLFTVTNRFHARAGQMAEKAEGGSRRWWVEWRDMFLFPHVFSVSIASREEALFQLM